jgi:NCAIR mutase (PurE)-related protein
MSASVPGPEAFADLGFARVDTGRQSRQGAPEAVYAPGKTDD